MTRAEGDPAGPFDLAIRSLRQEKNGQSAFIWVSSVDFLADANDKSAGNANTRFLTVMLDSTIGETEPGSASKYTYKAQSLMSMPLTV